MFIFFVSHPLLAFISILLRPDLSKNSRPLYCFKVLPISIHGTDLYIYIYLKYTYLHRSHKNQPFMDPQISRSSHGSAIWVFRSFCCDSPLFIVDMASLGFLLFLRAGAYLEAGVVHKPMVNNKAMVKGSGPLKLTKRKQVFQPSIFRGELLVSGRVYPYTCLWKSHRSHVVFQFNEYFN